MHTGYTQFHGLSIFLDWLTNPKLQIRTQERLTQRKQYAGGSDDTGFDHSLGPIAGWWRRLLWVLKVGRWRRTRRTRHRPAHCADSLSPWHAPPALTRISRANQIARASEWPAHPVTRLTTPNSKLEISSRNVWRRGWDSNPRMEVLQTSPLGHLGTAP